MSGDDFNNYYYPPGPGSGGYSNDKSWNDWMAQQPPPQQQYNGYPRNQAAGYETGGPKHGPHNPPHMPPRGPYHNNYYQNHHNNRNYHQPRRFNNMNNHHQGPQQQWNNRNSNYKRNRLDSDDPMEPKGKAKKKKKPLSQNVPSKKEWTMEEAEMALNCEKEYNKRHKNQSLIIKFPDLELNKEIVQKFNSAIENVHFQQPSTARFCFVTLADTAEADEVINSLNKVKFGEGFLTAEYKKDREEDQNIGPEDIDPHTLYVGNLAQEITKEDMVKAYPNSKRIDIGYAKKMKYTRYAFVTFKTVAETLEAFKKTHSTQMYSKSLIVRFRRLHGTVGMPGESKPQNPPKPTDKADENHDSQDNNKKDGAQTGKDKEKFVNLDLVKKEPDSSDEDERNERRLRIASCSYEMVPDDMIAALQPKIIKHEIKEEPDVVMHNGDDYGYDYCDIKEELDDEKDKTLVDEEEDDFDSFYNNMVEHANNIKSLGSANGP